MHTSYKSLAEEESMETATMVTGIDTTITPDTTDKEIELLHNPVKQKLVEQM